MGIILALFLIWLLLHLGLRSTSLRVPIAIAHRGGQPENTHRAIRRAHELGYRYVEIDVRLSSDKQLVVIHDATVDRTTNGSGAVGAMTAAEMALLDAGGGFSAENEPISTLETILQDATLNGMILLIEVKDPDKQPGIGAVLIALLRQYEAEERAIVISFSRDWLLELRDVAPAIEIMPLEVVQRGALPTRDRPVVNLYWVNAVADPTAIWRAHRNGHAVYVWTVNRSWQMRLMLWLGVDGISTDNLEALLKLTEPMQTGRN